MKRYETSTPIFIYAFSTEMNVRNVHIYVVYPLKMSGICMQELGK